jgi:hypothetical protein
MSRWREEECSSGGHHKSDTHENFRDSVFKSGGSILTAAPVTTR